MKILIIEDDIVIRNELLKFISANGFEVHCIKCFEDLLFQIKDFSPHLILLDINLPQNDGYTICRKFRETSNVPVIIITSRDTELDELMSMNLGADDFVRKPFHPQILLARIENILKRTYQIKSSDIIESGNLKLDVIKGSVSHYDKTEILTKNELAILKYFLTHKGEIVSRDNLIMYLWDTSSFIDDNTLSVNVTRLRKKMESIGVHNAIQTRRGLGYVMI